MDRKKEKRMFQYGIWLLTAAAVIIFMKYVSGLCSPFILAILSARILHGILGKLPGRFNHTLFGGILLILILGGILILGLFLGSLAVSKCVEIAGNTERNRQEVERLAGGCCDCLEKYFHMDREKARERLDSFACELEKEIRSKWVPLFMNRSAICMKWLTRTGSYLLVTLIALFLIHKDYERIQTLFSGIGLAGIRTIGEKVLFYIRTFLKTQLILLLIISSLTGVSLWLLRIRGAFKYGLLTGFLDMLPFIGTGLVLTPLAFFQLLQGCPVRAVLLLVLYIACVFTRSFLEPKLIGGRIGILPAGILFSVYAGIKLFGIFGIIKGPIGLVIILETYRYLFNTKEEGQKEQENYAGES